MLLHCLYCQNYLQENRSLDSFYEVYCSRICSLSLYVYYRTLHGITLLCLDFDIWEKLHKQICRNTGLTLVDSLEPLCYRRNVASWSLFYRNYFGRYSSELAELVSLPHCCERSTRYSNRSHWFFYHHS